MPGERTLEPRPARIRRRLLAGGYRPPPEPAPPLTAHRLFTTRPLIRQMTTTDRMTAAHHP